MQAPHEGWRDAVISLLHEGVDGPERIAQLAHLTNEVDADAVVGRLHELLDVRPRVVLAGELVEKRVAHIASRERVEISRRRTRHGPSDECGRKPGVRNEHVRARSNTRA